MKLFLISLVLLGQNIFANEVLTYPVDELTSVQIKYDSEKATYEVIHPARVSAVLRVRANMGISEKMCAYRLNQVIAAKNDPAKLLEVRKYARSIDRFELTGKILPSYPKSEDLVEFLKQHAKSKGKDFGQNSYISTIDNVVHVPQLTLSENSIYKIIGAEDHIEKINEQIRYKVDKNGVFKAYTNASDLICDLMDKRATLEMKVDISRIQGVARSLITTDGVRRLSNSLQSSYSKTEKQGLDGFWRNSNKDIILTSVLAAKEFSTLFGKDILSIGISNALDLISSLADDDGKPLSLSGYEVSQISERIKGKTSEHSSSKTNVRFEKVEIFK